MNALCKAAGKIARIPSRLGTVVADPWRRCQGTRRLRRQLPPHAGSTYAVVVAVPGGVHMADIAMSHLAKSFPLVCVSNGLSLAEQEYLRRRQPLATFVTTPYMLKHHDVIDVLIEKSSHSFWLVDHDCIVIKPDALRQADLDSTGRLGAVFFAERNVLCGFTKPHTFLMLLRPTIARDVFREFGISSAPLRWNQLPAKARDACEAVGLSQACLPELGKPVFDTLVAAAACAESQGRGFHAAFTYTAMFVPHLEAVHFGHTTSPVFHPDWLYAALGAYFWRSAFESRAAAELQHLRSYSDRLR